MDGFLIRVRAVGVAALVACSAGLVGGAVVDEPVASALSADQTACDFNGDGFEDQAIGVPQEDIGPDYDGRRAGAIQVLYGSSAGLTAAGNQSWHQGSPGILGDVETNDHFGTSLACGDFDADGVDDLAIGVPLENIGGLADAGAVQVLFGSPTGLTATGNQWWSQESAGIRGVSETDDRFGWSLAAGDFDGDGVDDLAIGVRGESIGAAQGAGAVQVLFGSSTGLTALLNQFWSQDSPGIIGRSERYDGFGWSLATGDFDGDGIDDLAIGVPFEGLPGPYNQSAGAVNVLFGSSFGFTAENNQAWGQFSPGVLAGQRAGADAFGKSLAAGDFDGDGVDDLAIGVPEENGPSCCQETQDWDVGTVQVLFGSATGLSGERAQWWHQNSPGIAGNLETLDRFGSSLASGDFNGDGVDDLAIGVPDETIGTGRPFASAGVVQVLFGTGSGLTATGSQVWSGKSVGLIGGLARLDEFGHTLATGDFNGDGAEDLAIGVPREDIGGVGFAGSMRVLLGSDLGLNADGNQLWSQDSPGIPGTIEVGDAFGASLGVGS